MYLLVGFSPLLGIKTISKIFVTDVSDFLMKGLVSGFVGRIPLPSLDSIITRNH